MDTPSLTEREHAMLLLWEAHLASEFSDKSANAAIDTMTEQPFVNHIPVLTGGVGREQLRDFYREHFIPQMPADTGMIPLSRTIGQDRIVDEFIFHFTHTVKMDWMLPGIEPTGKKVEVVLVVVVQFEGDKIAFERIHWDQATVLVQLGLLQRGLLPVAGVETVQKVLNSGIPSNELFQKGSR